MSLLLLYQHKQLRATYLMENQSIC